MKKKNTENSKYYLQTKIDFRISEKGNKDEISENWIS